MPFIWDAEDKLSHHIALCITNDAELRGLLQRRKDQIGYGPDFVHSLKTYFLESLKKFNLSIELEQIIYIACESDTVKWNDIARSVLISLYGL